MSYSRWGPNSRWYTYWLVRDTSGAESADEEVFVVCAVTSFTYQQLQERRKICLEVILETTDCSERELKELNGYMDDFCIDVEGHYRDLAEAAK